jgi:SUN domain-containing protein 1/2
VHFQEQEPAGARSILTKIGDLIAWSWFFPFRVLRKLLPLPVYTFLPVLIIIWYAIHTEISEPQETHVLRSSSSSNLIELSDRIRALETGLSSLILDNFHLGQESEKQRAELVERLEFLENKVHTDSPKFFEVQSESVDPLNLDIARLEQQLVLLQAELAETCRLQSGVTREDAGSAFATMGALEGRVAVLEKGLKGTHPAFQHDFTQEASTLEFTTDREQGVKLLVNDLVSSTIPKYPKDVLGLQDFALASGGARVVPSLTSRSYEYTRSAAIALHHELSPGSCWSFVGSRGRLGVKLSRSVFISHVTIDHVAKEVALDMRSAPREMELWGLVEGVNSARKVESWLQGRQRRMSQAAEGEEITPSPQDHIWVYPEESANGDNYIQISSFTYDIHSATNIQTFTVSPEVLDLKLHFRLVVLLVKSNWGSDKYTCLYRFRVHGERFEGRLAPLLES